MCLDTNYLQTAGLQWLIFKKSKTRKSAKRSFKKLSTLLSKQDMGNKTPEGAREQDSTWSQRVSVQEQPMMEGKKQRYIPGNSWIRRILIIRNILLSTNQAQCNIKTVGKGKLIAEESYESLKSKRQVVWHKDKHLKRLFPVMNHEKLFLWLEMLHFPYTPMHGAKYFKAAFYRKIKVWRGNQQTHKRRSLING